jgi:hypothetical protein
LEIDAFLAGEEETAVEGLIAGTEDEEMTPIPDEVAAQQEDQVEVAVEEEDEPEEETDPFPPGTLGKSLLPT